MTSISSIESFTLDLPPSCIAFCPTQPQIFVVGTYYLHHKDQQTVSTTPRDEVGVNTRDGTPTDILEIEQGVQVRTGSLILFRLEGEVITKITTRETGFAILDIQWTPHSQLHGDILAVATSTGYIVFYRLEIQNRGGDLIFLSQKAVTDPSILVLSIAWHPSHPNIIGFTLSNGDVSLCENTEGPSWNDDLVVQITNVHNHELEAWTLAFVGSEPIKVISGGDDIVLQCSSIGSLESGSLLWRDRKLHQAGITAILPLTSDLVVTGSYDDHIRLISTQPDRRRQVLAELNLSGGVWRLKVMQKDRLPIVEGAGQELDSRAEFKSLMILASCMHAGSRVLRLCKGQDGEWMFEVIAKFEEHMSMNYGSDVQPSDRTLKSIVSTSFYDKLLCLWQFDTSDIKNG